MLTLVYKDILAQKRSLWVIIFYIVFLHLVFYNLPDGGAYTGGAIGITYIFVLGACAQDDKNRSEILLNSLPISRKSLVVAKYLTAVFFFVVGMIASILMGTILHYVGFPRGLVNLETAISMVFAPIALWSFYYPIYFKFGYIKARYYNVLLFLAVFFGPVFLVAKITKGGIPSTWLEGWLQWAAHSDIAVAFMFIGFIVLMGLISLLISLKVYQNREFA